MCALRVVFFGSPEFAVPSLAALVESGLPPVLVVSQPARPTGRGRRREDPPVAKWAREHGLPVEQPGRVRDPEFLEQVRALKPDVAVVVAFGQIFPPALLEIPRLGCVNLHASLLPAYRGAAPIQAAIAAGESRTGVCTMLMEAGLDTGPLLLCEEAEIAPDDDSPRLAARLAALGAGLVVRTLAGLAAGTLTPSPQGEEGVSYAPRLHKEDGQVDWAQPAAQLERRARAYRPWPGLTTWCGGRQLKLVEVELREEDATGAAPGTFLGRRGDGLAVAAGEGSVLGLIRVQRPGRRPVSGAELLRAEALEEGRIEFAPAEPPA